MNKKHNIFLIGPMGCGKTSIGKILAEKLARPFYDSDTEIEKKTGVPVSWIFEKEGEAGFRKREAAMIADLTQHNNIILSTGGGAILSESNRQHLAQNGTIIYLQVCIDTQLDRTLRYSNRPLLNVENPKQKLLELSEARAPLYASIADITLNTDDKTPLQLARKILRTLKMRNKKHQEHPNENS